MTRVVKSMVLALLSFLVTTKAAFAYIDPNTGGMLFQALATSLAVLTGFALLFSRQIRTLIGRARRSLRRTSGGEDQQAPDAAVHVEHVEDQEQK